MESVAGGLDLTWLRVALIGAMTAQMAAGCQFGTEPEASPRDE